MAVPLRRILKIFYPDRFSARQPKKTGASFITMRLVFRLLILILILKVVFLLFYYNTFLSMQYDVEESRAQIDTQLQRRKNIILNLSLLVRDYAKHEMEIFTHTTDARKKMVDPGSVMPPDGEMAPDTAGGRAALGAPQGLGSLISKSQMTADDLNSLLSRVFAIAEQYPSLRLSENFQRFMDALVEAEDKIAEQRMIYNVRANDMSTEVGKFPGFLFAKIFSFEAPPFFEPEEEARLAPRVEYASP